jgi:hypothetical protein
MTERRRILAFLEDGPVGLREISKALGLRERDVLDHLEHIARSVAPSRRIRISPAFCHECGFIFRKRTRFSTPGKCPQCRSQRIQPPEFAVSGKPGHVDEG